MKAEAIGDRSRSASSLSSKELAGGYLPMRAFTSSPMRASSPDS